MNSTADLTLGEIRQLLLNAERSVGPESQTAGILREIVARREQRMASAKSSSGEASDE